MAYSVGTRISVSRVEVSRPPITTMASGREMKPPSPVSPKAIGVSAKMVAIAVIRIGRSRCRPPSTTASRTPMPWARYWLTRSSSTMAFVTTMPTSMSTPISAGTLSAVPLTSSRAIAPVAANGMETSRMSACTTLRNVAIMIRKTIAIAASTARPRSAKVSRCSALTPPRENVAPGTSIASSRLCSSVLIAPRSEPVTVPVTETLRSPSIRRTCCGPVVSVTSAMSSSLTPPTGRARSSATVIGGAADRRSTTSRAAPSTVT